MNLGPLATGSQALLRQFGDWLLPGQWRAASSRLAGCAVTSGFGFTVLDRAHAMAWPLAGGWCIAAWRIGRAVERQEAAEADFVQWIRDQIGDRNGVLVWELLDGLHQADMHKDWDAAALRDVIERLGIHVRDSLKVGGYVSTGVHIDDLRAAWDVHVTPPPAKVANPSPGPVTSENYPTTPRVDVHAEGAQVTITPAREGDN